MTYELNQSLCNTWNSQRQYTILASENNTSAAVQLYELLTKRGRAWIAPPLMREAASNSLTTETLSQMAQSPSDVILCLSDQPSPFVQLIDLKLNVCQKLSLQGLLDWLSNEADPLWSSIH